MTAGLKRASVFSMSVICLWYQAEGRCRDDDKKEIQKGWKKKVVTGINLTQSAYSNWETGGENSFAWSLRLDADANRNGGALDWSFNSDMVFGQTKLKEESPRTTTDKIDVDGTVGIKFGPYINPYLGAGILTQFSMGYDYSRTPKEAKSSFWDPAYLTVSLGARAKIKDIFNSQLGIGLKETITSHYRQYSDDPGTDEKERFKFETGIESKSKLDAAILKNLQMRSKLEIFSSFEHLDIIDIGWDTLLTAKLNKYIAITLNVQINYDKDVINKAQIKEILGIGFSYNFY
jgi:hypothetical protein